LSRKLIGAEIETHEYVNTKRHFTVIIIGIDE